MTNYRIRQLLQLTQELSLMRNSDVVSNALLRAAILLLSEVVRHEEEKAKGKLN